MLNKADAIKQAKSFIKETQASGLNFRRVILFGSSVRDEMHEYSDIDILLVSDKFTDNPIENIKLYSKINIKYPAIETHPFSTEYYQKSDPFIEEVKATGLIIH